MNIKDLPQYSSLSEKVSSLHHREMDIHGLLTPKKNLIRYTINYVMNIINVLNQMNHIFYLGGYVKQNIRHLHLLKEAGYLMNGKILHKKNFGVISVYSWI